MNKYENERKVIKELKTITEEEKKLIFDKHLN